MSMESVHDKSPAVVREGLCLLGGVVAILMQVAHPKVALAISEHSSFEANLRHRIVSTLTYVYIVLLGEVGEGEELAGMVKSSHANVKGRGEMPYAASDADLLLWVNATVYSGMVGAFERAFGPMDKVLAAHVLQRFGRLGKLLHEDSDQFKWPNSREKFDDYWQKTYEALIIHPKESKKLQETLFNIQKHVTWPWKPIFVVARPFALAYVTMSLPNEIRRQYDLNPTKSTIALNYLVRVSMRHVYPHLPSRLRQLPSEYILHRARSRKKFRENSNYVE